MSIRLVLVDDEDLVRFGLRTILDLTDDIDVVGEASDGAQAVSAARALRPEVVLMDIRMPRVDGLAATRQILDQPDPPKVVILTTFHLDEYVYSALQAGASGFLLKDTPPRQIVTAIRAVAAGSEMLSPAVTRRLIAEYVAPATTHNASNHGANWPCCPTGNGTSSPSSDAACRTPTPRSTYS